MPKGIPAGGGGADIAPLPEGLLTNVPLARMAAFQQINTRKDDKTGDEIEITQIKLSLDWDSGQPIRDTDGNIVTDSDGNEQPHYINDGFVTLSGDKRANLVKILKALGFGGYINEEGYLDDVAQQTLEVEFGFSGEGGDYTTANWDELPFYVNRKDGGKKSKRDVEVGIRSFKIDGHEVLGRTVNLNVTIDPKSSYNRIDAYMKASDPLPLGATAPAKAKGMPAEKVDTVEDPFISPAESTARATQADESPFTAGNADEPEPLSKQAKYVTKRLQEAGVPPTDRLAVVRAMTGNPGVSRIFDISVEDARTFKAMVDADETVIVEAYKHIQATAIAAEEAFGEDDEDF